MIAVDSSVIVGLIKGEPDVAPLLDVVCREPVALGTPTVVEIRAWCARRLAGGRSALLEELLAGSKTVVSPFTVAMADAAGHAFAVYGRGSGHAAGLNFGDALVYGHARTLGLPLLFKGGDFQHTDLAIDPRSVVIG